jgi:hypothetical protein
MTEGSDGWTKWWWLGYFGVQTWTVEERKVRIALGMTMILVFGIVTFTISPLLSWLGVERHVAAILAGLASLWLAFYSARPIATILYPDQLRSADLNAEKRLSKKADA